MTTCFSELLQIQWLKSYYIMLPFSPHVLSEQQWTATMLETLNVHLDEQNTKIYSTLPTLFKQNTADLLKLLVFVCFDWQHDRQWLAAHVIEHVKHERRLIGQHADTCCNPINVVVSYWLSTATVLLVSVLAQSPSLAICSPSGCTVASSIVGICNRSQMRNSKCTGLIFGVSIGLDPG